MDTSETYIKMRRKAMSDLGMGEPPKIGTDNDGNTLDPEWYTSQVFVDIKGDFYYASGIEHCQLERRDQLQEMMGLDTKGLVSRLLSLNLALSITPETSMEQLWLAFVMKEKYNKTWNGEEWVET